MSATRCEHGRQQRQLSVPPDRLESLMVDHDIDYVSNMHVIRHQIKISSKTHCSNDGTNNHHKASEHVNDRESINTVENSK